VRWWEVSWVRSGVPVGDGVRCNRVGSDGSSGVVPSSVGEIRRDEVRLGLGWGLHSRVFR